MSGETPVKCLQRVLVDSPDVWSGDRLVYERGAGFFEAQGEVSIPGRARIGHPRYGANPRLSSGFERSLPQCLPQAKPRLRRKVAGIVTATKKRSLGSMQDP